MNYNGWWMLERYPGWRCQEGTGGGGCGKAVNKPPSAPSTVAAPLVLLLSLPDLRYGPVPSGDRGGRRARYQTLIKRCWIGRPIDWSGAGSFEPFAGIADGEAVEIDTGSF